MKQLEKDFENILKRREKPVEGSYTTYLFNKGLEKILKKVGEEKAYKWTSFGADGYTIE